MPWVVAGSDAPSSIARWTVVLVTMFSVDPSFRIEIHALIGRFPQGWVVGTFWHDYLFLLTMNGDNP